MGIFDPNVEQLSQRGDTEGLLKALIHRKEEVRESASKALSEITDPEERSAICNTLIELISECDLYRSIHVVQTLGLMKCKTATTAICYQIDLTITSYLVSGMEYELDTSYDYGTSTFSELIMETDTDKPLGPHTLYRWFIGEAVKSLVEIGDPSAIPTLKRAIRKAERLQLHKATIRAAIRELEEKQK
jgi:HEAT repeat protein